MPPSLSGKASVCESRKSADPLRSHRPLPPAIRWQPTVVLPFHLLARPRSHSRAVERNLLPGERPRSPADGPSGSPLRLSLLLAPARLAVLTPTRTESGLRAAPLLPQVSTKNGIGSKDFIVALISLDFACKQRLNRIQFCMVGEGGVSLQFLLRETRVNNIYR